MTELAPGGNIVVTAANGGDGGDATATAALGGQPTAIAGTGGTRGTVIQGGDTLATGSDGKTGAASQVTPHTFTNAGSYDVGNEPSGIVTALDGSTYVANRLSSNVSQIRADGVITDISVGGQPFALALNRSNNTLYVANFDNDAVAVVDLARGTTTGRSIRTAEPNTLVVSPNQLLLYAVNQYTRRVSEFDTTSRALLGQFVTDEQPSSVDISPDGGTLYVSNLDAGTVTIYSTATRRQLASRSRSATNPTPSPSSPMVRGSTSRIRPATRCRSSTPYPPAARSERS